jgi:hypothetical protein
VALVAALAVVAGTALSAAAQTVDPGVSGANGVVIDAQGVLRMQHFPDPGGQLVRQRIAQARANLNPDVAKASKLRKVSLNRLEAAARARLEKGQQPSEEMAFLAGLTRVRYLFYYPDTRDIVLAGPAEGWAADATGRACGIESGRPALQLQDLLVALRAFAPGKHNAPTIRCTIDPTPEGLARMQQFVRSLGSRTTADAGEMIAAGLRSSLGMQNISVTGISPNTHFAHVILECDYRMKLIGIGVEPPPVRMATFIERAMPSSNHAALERWYFIPDYNCARVAADHLGLELVGDGVTLVSENQFVARDGSRKTTGKGNKASELFAKSFTAKFTEIAARLPVFAEMRNVIDLAIVAAFINQQDFYAQAEWRAATFNDEQALRVETYKLPLQVETVCIAVRKGNRMFWPVGGGVTIRPREALATANVLGDEDGALGQMRDSIELGDLPADRWWWD